jgi:hypothetical protein
LRKTRNNKKHLGGNRCQLKSKPAKKTVKRAAVKKTSKTRSSRSSKKQVKIDLPSLFRLNLEVGNLDQAAEFYGRLFGLKGSLYLRVPT